MAFIINVITAKSDYLITTSSGTNTFPIPAPIWSLLSPQPAAWYADGTGSKLPRLFSIPPDPTDVYDVSIQLEGLFTFPTTWTGSYEVQACVAGISTPILSSEPQIVPPPSNPPIPVPISIASFKVIAPFKDFACPVPFCWTGDFEWKISNVNVEGNRVSAALQTRLELCWAHAEATSGPLSVRSEFLDTRVNFGSSYPIGLIRQFWPRPSEFQEVVNFNYIEVCTPWYIKRAMNSIWDWGTPHQVNKPCYDTRGGAASYNVNGLGGNFDLQRWLAPCSPPGTCNSYDLAAISQLACALLLNSDGNEIARSQWVLQAPNGFILPGTLYGREAVPDCNNPFFEARGSPPFVDPKLNPLDLKVNRSSFGKRAWIEFRYPAADTRHVLDATHGIGAVPEFGAKSRQEYATAHIDSTWDLPSQPTAALFGNLANNGVTAPSGNCYQTPEYRLSVTDPSRIDRIGVQGIIAAVPMPLPSAEFNLPGEMRRSIEAALNLGLNPEPPQIGYHNASVDQASVITAFAPSDELQHLQTFNSIARHHTRTSHDLLQANGVGFTVDILTHVNYEDPIKSMIHHLASFEAPLADVVSASPIFLGSRSLQTLSSFFWVRGNLFIVLTYTIVDDLLLSRRKDDLAQLQSQHLNLATKLDQYLAQNTVDTPLVAKPNATLAEGMDMPKQVKVGTVFTIRLAQPQTAATETYCESDDPGVIVAGGVMTEDGTFSFYARRTGATALTLFLAHKDTLYPDSRDFVVEVVD